MGSIVEVANLAAVRMGTAGRIMSLDDDRTVARTLKAVWDIERRATIRDGSWNFAARRAALASVVDPAAVIYPWTYGFEMPADSLRLIEVLGYSRDAYAREGDVILCDSAGPLYIRHAVDVPELAQWDAAAVQAFAIRLAWRCGRKIAGAAFDLEACWTEYRGAIGAAKRVDALENPPISTEHETDSWEAARLGNWK